MLIPSCLVLALLGDIDDAMALLDRVDQTFVAANYVDEPLAVVVDELAESSGISIRGDWESLHGAGIRPRDLVSLRLERSPLSTVLSGLVLVLGDDLSRPVWEVHAGQVVLTSLEATVPMRETDVYDVRDLINDGRTLERLRRERPPVPDVPDVPEADTTVREAHGRGTAPEAVPEGHGGATAPPAPEPPQWTAGEELLHLVVEHVDPEAWIDFGGSRGKISERDGVLLVTVAPTVHRRLRAALERLREAHPSTLHLEVAIVDVPEAGLARLRRAHDPGSRNLARALLREEGAQVLWQTTAAVSPPGRLDVSSRREGGPQIDLHMGAAIEPVSEQIELTITAGTAGTGESDDKRSVETRVILPTRHGAAIIELPPPQPGPSRRLLLIVPEA